MISMHTEEEEGEEEEGEKGKTIHVSNLNLYTRINKRRKLNVDRRKKTKTK